MKGTGLVIRFKRIGYFKKPSFEIIVTLSKTRCKSGSFLEKIGFYNPSGSENCYFLNSYRLGF